MDPLGLRRLLARLFEAIVPWYDVKVEADRTERIETAISDAQTSARTADAAIRARHARQAAMRNSFGRAGRRMGGR